MQKQTMSGKSFANQLEALKSMSTVVADTGAPSDRRVDPLQRPLRSDSRSTDTPHAQVAANFDAAFERASQLERGTVR